ncbi:MAG: patatin-like phospholipase family protein [Gemmatimonadales bacterium]|nr:patatin-like phospholipase family protein [Gemmatimonadales bacterium]
MMRCRLRGFFILTALGAATGPLAAQDCRAPRTALVLSGGGAKGIAHVGVLAALDSLGIRPDLIVGSSMGAAVGALYASGYSGRELDSLVRTVPLARLFRTYRPRAPRSLGVLRPLVMWEQGDRRFTLQSASIVEPELNALVSAAMLRGNLIARGDFDSLPIPFRAVATDLATGKPVVIRSGDLAQAVRASIAIPLVFAPEVRDSQFLADGGLSANIPVAVARAEGAERVIVSDATEHSAESFDGYSPINVADRLIEFLFQQPAESLRAGDVMVRPDVEGFNSLNFSPARVERLLVNGRAAADSSLADVECRRAGTADSGRRLPRRVTGFTARAANDSERLALERMFGFGLSDTLDADLLRSRVRGLSASDTYNSVWLGPHGSGDSVAFDLSLRRASRRVVAIGLGYDNELGGRMWAGAVDRRIFGLALEGSAALFLDAFRKELYTGFRRKFQIARQLMDPTLTVRIATEDVRRFDPSGDELDELETREALGFAGVERVFSQGWEIGLGLHGHVWREAVQGERSALGLAGRAIRVSRSRGRVVRAEGVWTGVYQRARMEAELLGHFGVVRFTPRVMVGWGDDLPLQLGFPLGGDDGFPGLHIGERRGDREAMLGLMFTTPIKGPLLGRVELAAGRTAIGGPLLGDDGWVGGVRAGIGADTPVGPVRFEYGYSTEERGAVFVRLGDWP